MNKINFRPFDFSEQDYETAVSIWNAVWPDSKTAINELKHQDERRDKRKFFHRVMGELDGRVAGIGTYCETWWFDTPGRYFISFDTHPDFQRCGLATAYYAYVMDILRQRGLFNSLQANTREDKPESIRFLKKLGFQQTMRFPRSHLDVQQFDPERFSAKVEAVRTSGIEIMSLAELRERDPDWLHKTWEMECEVIKDVPAPDPIQPTPFEQYQKGVDGPSFFPEAYVVAVDNGRYVGSSALWLSEADPEKLYTGLTGVLRSHRRQGLATAMKTKTISYAKDLGYKLIETDNEENNPMFQINLQLGFVPQPAELDFHKEITEEDL